ncbi:hypothetical protein ELR57_07825 [Cohnella sp. AR92]|nr:hypothetical protein ELR57_07825 [Cohnella sp. AR92]
MKSVNELDSRLKEAVQSFNHEVRFMLDTFEQSHEDECLTKRDLEEIGRQVFYCLSEFREHIVDFLNKQNGILTNQN